MGAGIRPKFKQACAGRRIDSACLQQPMLGGGASAFKSHNWEQMSTWGLLHPRSD